MAENSNRIGSRCWYKNEDSHPWKPGKVLSWSSDSKVVSSGQVLTFPVAIVENTTDCRVHSVPVKFIDFSGLTP